MPASPALVYFVVGMALGPWGFDWLHPDPARHAVMLERACELAVIVSLFATGSAVGTTLRVAHWRVPVRLATVAMMLTIGLIALFAYFVLGLAAGAAVLLAGALAPTDPVLAGDVQVADAQDRDRLRFGLTGEAGLNDGAAFPFVLLGLALIAGRSDWGRANGGRSRSPRLGRFGADSASARRSDSSPDAGSSVACARACRASAPMRSSAWASSPWRTARRW